MAVPTTIVIQLKAVIIIIIVMLLLSLPLRGWTGTEGQSVGALLVHSPPVRPFNGQQTEGAVYCVLSMPISVADSQVGTD